MATSNISSDSTAQQKNVENFTEISMNHKPEISVQEIAQRIERKLVVERSVQVESASDEQFYKASALVLRDILEERRKAFVAKNNACGKKQVYYLSMEFLVGRSLRNNLYNLGLQQEFEKALETFNVKLAKLYECEPDPGLGNGGLGRLAACYLDGLATTGHLGTGYSILYEYGIFKQKIDEGWQRELPDYWLPGGDVWLESIPEHAVEVRFGGRIEEKWDNGIHMVKHVDCSTVLAIPYNLYISGYDSEAVSLLRLWRAKSPGIDMERFNNGDYLGAFGQNNYAEVISKVLYPNDNHTEGKLLRLRQQYFLSAAAVSDIFRRHMSVYGTINNFAEKNAIHINDTHPTLAIPELMRVLLDECGYDWDASWNIVKNTFAYTNHTVMAEALEQWDMGLVQTLLPRIYQIIDEINRRFCIELRERYHKSEQEIRKMSIICDGKIRMANLCIVGSHSINGVSKLHSDIIKNDVFRDFYSVTPAKFNNVTNGIASRRWLLQANPLLTNFIIKYIGDEFLHDLSKLKELRRYETDKTVLEELAHVKLENKKLFAQYLQNERGITVDPNTLFDVQVKRLHEYKRQHLNALHIIKEYLDIKENPNKAFQPKTYFFGAKAAPGYYLAKKIIKLIYDFGQILDHDPDVHGKLKIVFLEEYNVSLSERLMPASEISEQISLAGTEASGTGNMKLMLNGAVTMGTLDGANVEIHEAVGDDNILLFGMHTPEVESMKKKGYHPAEFIEQSEQLQRVLNFMQSRSELSAFADITNHLRNIDTYMAAADFESYCKAQEYASDLYQNDNLLWQKMSLINIAESGIFAADRAVTDYVERIWDL